MQFVIGQFELLRRFGAKLGPYVLLELLLPGGTLFALLLFLYQRWKLNAGSLPTLIGAASPRELVSTLGRGILAMQPCHAFAAHGSCLRVCYGQAVAIHPQERIDEHKQWPWMQDPDHRIDGSPNRSQVAATCRHTPLE
jgi:hypothetical protein